MLILFNSFTAIIPIWKIKLLIGILIKLNTDWPKREKCPCWISHMVIMLYSSWIEIQLWINKNEIDINNLQEHLRAVYKIEHLFFPYYCISVKLSCVQPLIIVYLYQMSSSEHEHECEVTLILCYWMIPGCQFAFLHNYFRKYGSTNDGQSTFYIVGIRTVSTIFRFCLWIHRRKPSVM